jgi:hypothetical protein
LAGVKGDNLQPQILLEPVGIGVGEDQLGQILLLLPERGDDADGATLLLVDYCLQPLDDELGFGRVDVLIALRFIRGFNGRRSPASAARTRRTLGYRR